MQLLLLQTFGAVEKMSAPATIFDLFFKPVYRCDFCGTFRERKKAMQEHVRQWHGDAVRAEVRKQTAVISD